MRALRFARFSLAPAILAAMVLSGCGKDSPTKPHPPLPPLYSIPSSPAEVLANLEIAYSQRDSVGYKALYDSSYVGISRDQNDPPGTPPITLTYADEVSHVAKLASRSTITFAYMNLGPPLVGPGSRRTTRRTPSGPRSRSQAPASTFKSSKGATNTRPAAQACFSSSYSNPPHRNPPH